MTHGLDINRKEPQIVRIPFLDTVDLRPGQEGLNTKDRIFLNGFFEPVKDPATGEVELHFIKRPGLQSQGSVTAAVGRGIYWSQQWNRYIAVFGNKVYASNTVAAPFTFTDTGITLITNSGMVRFAETRPGASPSYVGISDGQELYLLQKPAGLQTFPLTIVAITNQAILTSSVANPTTITTNGNHNLITGMNVIIRNHTGSTPSINDVLRQITVTGPTTFTIPVNVTVGGTGGTVGVFPTPSSNIEFLDGYWFVMDGNNNIWNSNLDDPTTWDSLSFITALMKPGLGVGLGRQSNFLIAFSTNGYQAFVDAANPVGSPLANVDQGSQQIGCASTSSIASVENEIYWVSRTANLGGLSVHRLSNTTNLNDIGTSTLNRDLSSSNVISSGGFIGNIMRFGGHIFYVLTLQGLNITWVYDQTLNMWFKWSKSDGTSAWPTISIVQSSTSIGAGNKYLVGQDTSSGDVWAISNDFFRDDGNDFPVVVQTNPLTFGTMARKFYNRAELIGDRQSSTANALLQFSDDDYETLSTSRTLDMSQKRAFTRNLSNGRRRAWKLSYSGNTPMRVFGLEFTIELDVS